MNAPDPVGPTRRQVLGWFGAAAGAAAGGALLPGCTTDARHATSTTSPSGPRPTFPSRVPPGRRVLVVVELSGGNDGLSTLIPHDDGHYHDLRPTLALGADHLLDIGGGYSLNAALTPIHEKGLTVLTGIGVRTPSLSHFDMLARWWAGTPDATTGGGTGFLGRVCDRLGSGDHWAGVSISQLSSLAIVGTSGNTVSIPSGEPRRSVAAPLPSADDEFDRAVKALGAAGTGAGPSATASKSLGRMLSASDLLAGLPAASGGYPAETDLAGSFGAQMAFASQLIRADNGVRVIHVTMDRADFDTHEMHLVRHAKCMNVLVPGLTAFRTDLETHGLTDRVLIATTSEFGRRAAENSTGLDHGAASCALLMGPVKPGVVGEHPSLTKLDPFGNLVSTVSFADYYATLATWLDVDPTSVISGRPRAIEALLAA